jgi:predicted membrane-bound spermidine synthase/tetratricopeptide (TPR) repeat protein
MKGIRFIIFFLFFLSGMGGLIYEVVWARYLSLFLGNTAQAHTFVLATFMGGLAVGYFLFGKMADRAGSALNLYGWMEIAIGLFGALFVPLLGWLGSAYVSLVSRHGLDSIFAAPAKFILIALLLVVPTVLMGGTLPVLSRFAVRSLREVESQVGWLYFVNSLGATAGSLLAGFFLIRLFGLNLSIVVAVMLNLLAGLVALALRPWEKGERNSAVSPTALDDPPRYSYTPWQIRIAILGIALSGGAALIYEIAWIRLLSLVLGSSTYSFSLMLAAFIAGIASGSFIVSRRWVARFEPYLLFALAELGVALSIILTLPFYERLPFYFTLWANFFVRAPQTFWIYQLIQFSICFFLMFLPTLFLGITLPLVSQVATPSLKRLGENVGNVFAANTVGTLVGAVAAGLALLPLLGIKRLIEIGVLINLLVGALALGVSPYLTWKKKTSTLGASFALFLFYLYLFPAWDQNILSSGTFRMRGLSLAMTYNDFKRSRREKMLFYKDGASATIAVTQTEDKHIILTANGKPEASTSGDLPTQILLGQIPFLLKPEARNALVVGLGSGITAGSVLRHPLARLDVVEISPEVVEGSRFFASHNYEALKDPRLRLHVEDAKTFLKVTPQRYDIVISEPSNPWIAGIGNLFSMEFYQDVRKRLQPDGLVVQWIHTYEMTDDTLKLVLRTFTASFEHVTLWSSVSQDLLMIGSKAPLQINYKESLARFNDAEVKKDLRRIGVESLPTILSSQVASDEGVRKAAGKGRVNEDLFPILEYQAPKDFFLGQTSQFLSSYDERRYPREGSFLYFTQYLKDRPMSAGEIKNLASYHLSFHFLTPSGVARNFVDLWMRHDPKDPEAHWALARIEQQGGNHDAARRELQYLLRLNPNNHDYLEAAAHLEFQSYLNERSYLASHSPEKTLSYLHRILGLDGGKKDRIYRKIAQVYAAKKDYQAAIGYLKKAIDYLKKNHGGAQPDTLWLEAANMAIEMDDFKSALDYSREALAYNPENRAAKESLNHLSQRPTVANE